MRFAADHDEQRGRGHLLNGVVRAVSKGDGFERPVAGAVDHLGAVAPLARARRMNLVPCRSVLGTRLFAQAGARASNVVLFRSRDQARLRR